MADDSVRAHERAVVLHPATIRLTHWVWALGIFILIGSGWRIYNAEPLFDFRFPVWATIGGDPLVANKLHNDWGTAGALLWHFFAMWLLFLSVLVYVAYALATGHFARKFLPIWPRQVVADVLDFLRGRLAHDIGTRNAVQRLLYAFAVVAMIVMIWSGLVLWKPTQLQELGVPMGGYEGARYVHFFGMAAIVLFIVVHVALTLLVPKVLPPMITGRARLADLGPHAEGEAA
jgi:thiosulfate reductase cytochrome b subunit